jgi:hypothetical protein
LAWRGGGCLVQPSKYPRTWRVHCSLLWPCSLCPQLLAAGVPAQPVQANGGSGHQAQHLHPPRLDHAVRAPVSACVCRNVCLCAGAGAWPRFLLQLWALVFVCVCWGGGGGGIFVSLVKLGCRFGPWFVEPVIAGLEGPDNKPWVSAMDLVGAPVFTSDFVLSGTCSANMYGMCESLYRPDMVSRAPAVLAWCPGPGSHTSPRWRS